MRTWFVALAFARQEDGNHVQVNLFLRKTRQVGDRLAHLVSSLVQVPHLRHRTHLGSLKHLPVILAT